LKKSKLFSGFNAPILKNNMVKLNLFSSHEKRPLLKITPTSADKVLEGLGWAVLIALWALTAYNYQILPDTIAVHFDFSGKPDRFDHKSSLFQLPVIATAIAIVLSVLCRFPQVFNYSEPITIANVELEYRKGIQMLRGIKISLTVVFLIIVYYTQSISLTGNSASDIWLLPCLLLIIFTPLLIAGFTGIKDRLQ
jgi:uncharacterized membrane protein